MQCNDLNTAALHRLRLVLQVRVARDVDLDGIVAMMRVRVFGRCRVGRELQRHHAVAVGVCVCDFHAVVEEREEAVGVPKSKSVRREPKKVDRAAYSFPMIATLNSNRMSA